MIVMENPGGDAGAASEKRKRRPKSYQGCTQCRLARRKCGEGILHPKGLVGSNREIARIYEHAGVPVAFEFTDLIERPACAFCVKGGKSCEVKLP